MTNPLLTAIVTDSSTCLPAALKSDLFISVVPYDIHRGDKLAYMHAGALEKVKKLKNLLEKRVEVAESFISELSPDLMVHTGPGTTCLCYFSINR